MTTQPEPDSLRQRIDRIVRRVPGNSGDEYGLADAVLAVVQPVIDEADLLRRGAAERADLLEEARDALAAVGQNGAHGDDWPAIAPSIRALGERARNAEAALARVRDLVADMQGITGARWWAEQLTTALTPPVPADGPEASSAGIDWRDIAAQREEARCAAVSEANRANAVLAAITALAFDADLRPDVRLSRIRNLIDPADGGEQV